MSTPGPDNPTPGAEPGVAPPSPTPGRASPGLVESDSVSLSGAGPAPITQVIEERTEQQYIPCFFKYITAITRLWTLVTIGTLWAVTVALIKQKENFTYTPWYMLAVSVFITVFEMIWVLDKCASKFRDDGCLCCCRLWRALAWIDNWKKSILYVLLAVPCFLEGIAAWQAILCGLFIIITAFFYFMKSFRDSKCIHRKKHISKYTRITNMEAGGTATGRDYGSVVQDQPDIKVTPAQDPASKSEDSNSVSQPPNTGSSTADPADSASKLQASGEAKTNPFD